MTVCGKPGKTIKLFTHPCHKPWKSLRDSHIPSALRLINSIQFSNPKRSLPQLPIPPTFRLILQLEKTEGKRISLVTMTARCFFIMAQGSDYRRGQFTVTQSSRAEPGLRSPGGCLMKRSIDGCLRLSEQVAAVYTAYQSGSP